MPAPAILNIEAQNLPPTLDTRLLREQARQRIEALAGSRWTDYNAHDPGITILELLAYSITDLGLRTRLDINDLIAGREEKPFFTAREVLPSAPITPDDYKRLLTDSLPLRSAWVLPAPDPIKGLNRLLLDLHQPTDPIDPTLPNLNEIWLRGTLLQVGASPLEFYVMFPFWEQSSPIWANLQLDLSKVEVLDVQTAVDHDDLTFDLFFVALRLTFGTGTGAQVLDNFGCWVRLPNGIPKTLETGLEPTDETAAFRQALSTQLNLAFFQPHQKRARLRAKALTEARRFVEQHRNLCEDWAEIDTIRIQQIGVNIAALDLQPEADPVEVLARICFAVDQFIAPMPRPHSFEELLAEGRTAAEILEGPLLQKGFLSAAELRPSQREDKIYTSDLVRLVMQQPEVIGVNRLTINVHMDRIRVAEGVANCLTLRDTERYKPRFSFFDTDIRVFKRGVLLSIDQKAVQTRWQTLDQEYRAGFPKNGSGDLPVPPGDARLDIATLYSLQNEFPATYGLREGEIVSNAPELRKAQAKQLKAYLLFFEQLLSNYCKQLDRLQDLFSTRPEADRTYFFQPLYDVPAVRDLYTAFLKEKTANPPITWEQFKQFKSNGYVKKLDEATEDRDTFLHRRNQFVDHLLARFGEQFADYAALSYARNRGQMSPDLVFDKIDFLQRIPELSRNRATAFDYAATASDLWNTSNVSGYEKRVSGLLGIPNHRRRTLGAKFDLLAYREVTNKQGTGNAQTGRIKLWSAPVGQPAAKPLLVSDKSYLVSLLDQHVNDLQKSGRSESAYRAMQDSDNRAIFLRYTLELTNPETGALIPAKAPDPFTNRALLEAHIRDTMHLLQGRPAEGMHVVEHVLLRPVEGINQLLEPVQFEGIGDVMIPEPHSFQVSIFLPGWVPRFLDPEFRVVVERVLCSELPAHVFPYIYWVELDNGTKNLPIVPIDPPIIPAVFIAFETAWKTWLENRSVTNLDNLVGAMNQLVASGHAVQAYQYEPFNLLGS